MCNIEMPKYKIRTEPLLSMVEEEIRVPYWYKKHEVENERSKKYPDIATRNAMMYYNLRSDKIPIQELKEDEKTAAKMEKIHSQISGDIYRPRPVVFDAQGKFHRTRVDEQSWL